MFVLLRQDGAFLEDEPNALPLSWVFPGLLSLSKGPRLARNP